MEPGTSQPHQVRPHIVFVVLDTQRRDRLGCYGYGRGTSPNLDAFAQGATVFEQAISPAQWTIPAHASFFSGEFPSTHMTVHGSDAIDPRFQTLAERLRSAGYRATGFCNNPLVGVLDNGFRRGFESFYNYGGAIPAVPTDTSDEHPGLLSQMRTGYQRWLYRFSERVQNLFTRPNRIFRLAMSPLLVPLWTRYARFKGDTAASIRDVVRFVKTEMGTPGAEPHFLFVNLMQTHLPFTPPQRYVDTFAPIFNEDRSAAAFMRAYNKQAMRWMFPLNEPLPGLHFQVMSDMYDAEVAYQDHLLAGLLDVLNRQEHLAGTMVIFVSDHGEMLGEHQLMGHGLGIYQELAHVPLMIRVPGQAQGRRVAYPVSTAQLFHTVLDAASVEVTDDGRLFGGDVERLSLTRVPDRPEATNPLVFAEAYPPDTVLAMMETHEPDLMEAFHVRSTVRAIYKDRYKLIHAEGAYEELYALDADPWEQQGLNGEFNAGRISELVDELESFVVQAKSRRPRQMATTKVDTMDESVLTRLRGLGYMD